MQQDRLAKTLIYVRRGVFALFSLSALWCVGCRDRVPQSALSSAASSEDATLRVVERWTIEDFPGQKITQFESVFWEPDDTISLRTYLRGAANGKRVLEIGTGTGLLALCCLKYGAQSVVATDINPAALACAQFNANHLGLESGLEVRRVDVNRPDAYAVLGQTERFDLIVSNPPWEDGVPVQPADYAFYDPKFRLLKSLLQGLPEHLSADGVCLLAFGCREAIETAQSTSEDLGYGFRIVDDRQLDQLSETFLPGMLLEITLAKP